MTLLTTENRKINTLMQQAWLCFEKRNLEQSEFLIVRAARLAEQKYGHQSRKLLPVLNATIMIYAHQRNFAAAEAAFKQALFIVGRHPRSHKIREIELLENYAQVLEQADGAEKANGLRAQLLELQSQHKYGNIRRLARSMTPSRSFSQLKQSALTITRRSDRTVFEWLVVCALALVLVGLLTLLVSL